MESCTLFVQTHDTNRDKVKPMPRIAGIDIPPNKKTQYSLAYIYGIGPSNVKYLLQESGVDGDKRAKDLTADEILRLQRVLDRMNTEGNLRRLIRENIERLKRIGSYRGSRHMHSLPSRGQRTRVNARTRRGRRLTVGAMSKEMAAKIDAAKTGK
jgi:small subunit ribosomal protein S13